MHFSSALIAAMATLSTVYAVDIQHFVNLGCTGGVVGCYGVATNVCCTADRPFVGCTRWNGLPNPATAKHFDQKRCNIEPDYRGTNPPNANQQFDEFQNVNGMAGMWYNGLGREVSRIEQRAPVSMEPNYMIYQDESGADRKIQIPQGKFREVVALYQAGNVAALAAFPAFQE